MLQLVASGPPNTGKELAGACVIIDSFVYTLYYHCILSLYHLVQLRFTFSKYYNVTNNKLHFILFISYISLLVVNYSIVLT